MHERCSRCGAIKGHVDVVHEWEWIHRNPCVKEQVCKRCGATGQIDEKEHQWRRIYKPNSYEIQETCKSCGITRTYPSAFSTFIGQEEIKPGLMTLIVAACQKTEALHHLLLCGQPGMGKATLAKVIATEMGVNIKVTSGPAIGRPSDLYAILTNLQGGDILFIDEIHRLGKTIEEVLYSAMEEYALDIIIGKGLSARSVRLKLPKFTVIGTTSKPSQVDERPGNLMFMFDFTPYDLAEIGKIIFSSATQQGIDIKLEAANLLAEHSNGCPAEALLVLEKVHVYAIAYADGHITPAIARDALAIFGSKSNSPLFERQSISDGVRMFVWQRDGGHCVKCGSQENLEYDHIIPVSKGGSNTARNIQLLCEKCNRSKGANIAVDPIRGRK